MRAVNGSISMPVIVEPRSMVSDMSPMKWPMPLAGSRMRPTRKPNRVVVGIAPVPARLRLRPILHRQSRHRAQIAVLRQNRAVAQAQCDGGDLKVGHLQGATGAPQLGVK